MIYTIKEETVKELSSKLNEPKWLLDLRLKALNEFNKIPTPNLKYSMSVLTDTNRINFEDINTLNQISDTVKVENKDVIVLPFEEALKNNE